MPIPPIPAMIPNGIPSPAITKASKNTEFLLCFAVAPTDESMPNCFTLSLSDMEKELYIRDTEPNIIRAINIPPKLYKTILKLSMSLIPIYLNKSEL